MSISMPHPYFYYPPPLDLPPTLCKDSLRDTFGTNVLIYVIDRPLDGFEQPHEWNVRMMTDGGKYSPKYERYLWKIQCSLCSGPDRVSKYFYVWFDFNDNSLHIDERYDEDLEIVFTKSGKKVFDWIEKLVQKKLSQQKTLTINPVVDESSPNSILWFLQNSNHNSNCQE
jgi:hypothetical protein